MAKIDTNTGGFSFFKSGKKEKQEKVKKGSFSKKVEALLQKKDVGNELFDDDSSGDLEEFLDDVCALGEKLKESPSFDNIRQYKQAVKKFMQYVVNNMVSVDEQVSGVNILKRKRFTIISVVDRKLESLAMEILNNQHQQIDLLGKIDEINGMLVDMLR